MPRSEGEHNGRHGSTRLTVDRAIAKGAAQGGTTQCGPLSASPTAHSPSRTLALYKRPSHRRYPYPLPLTVLRIVVTMSSLLSTPCAASTCLRDGAHRKPLQHSPPLARVPSHDAASPGVVSLSPKVTLSMRETNLNRLFETNYQSHVYHKNTLLMC